MTVYISEGVHLLPWSDPEWRRGVEGWIEARLQELGLRHTDEPVRVYARKLVDCPSRSDERRRLFFKASSPTQAMEVALVKALAALSGDVVAPLASDDERGWMLMRDAGTRLRELPEARDTPGARAASSVAAGPEQSLRRARWVRNPGDDRARRPAQRKRLRQ